MSNKQIIEDLKDAALDIADRHNSMQRLIDNQRAVITEQHGKLAITQARLDTALHRQAAMDHCIMQHVAARKKLVRMDRVWTKAYGKLVNQYRQCQSSLQYNVEGLARADAKVRELDGDCNIMRLQRDAAARLLCDAEQLIAELEE